MSVLRFVAAVSVACAAAPSLAEDLAVYPVQTGAETVRFFKGVPTLNLETPGGAVQITPLPFDHGHVVFGVGVYNKGAQPANFGIENVDAAIGTETVPVLAVDELQKRAKSRAMWSQIGIAVLAGASAAAVSGAHTTDHYHSTLATPHGVYAWNASYRDNSLGVLGATAAVAGGAAGIAGVQNRLDYTLANLADDVVQTTTVDGEASYGGRLVLEKAKAAPKTPYDVHVVMHWAGGDYPFVFRVTKKGIDMPPPYAPAPVSAAAATAVPAPTPAVLTKPATGAPMPAAPSAPAAAAIKTTASAAPVVPTRS